MTIRKPFVIAAAILGAILPSITGCDPGHEFHAQQNSASIDGVTFTQETFSGLMGSQSIFVPLDVKNESKSIVVVDSLQLESKRVNSKAQVRNAPDDVAARAVAAGTTNQIGMLVDFQGKSASEALGDSFVAEWTIRIGQAEHKVRFEMNRAGR